MIVSVSRRTDIPAFYSEWFFNRVRQGFVYVKNPMNPKQISEVILNPETVDCFVFWTKDATPMVSRLNELDGFNYFFQYTITGYKDDIEIGLKNKGQAVDTFKTLSKKIGRNRMVLRYDPVFINDNYSLAYHYKAFERLCHELGHYTDICVISFLDLYRKITKNIEANKIRCLSIEEIHQLSSRFSMIAKTYNIKLQTCSETYDLSQYGISMGKCIDDERISKMLGCSISASKDKNQREACGCISSVDIGQYNTCMHRCIYCYANIGFDRIKKNYCLHNSDYPLLFGTVELVDKITRREMKSIRCDDSKHNQLSLLDRLKDFE